MGLFDKLKGEFVDIIEWTDSSNDTMVWRFPRYQNEIKMGAKLTVRESQVAVFVNEGQMAAMSNLTDPTYVEGDTKASKLPSDEKVKLFIREIFLSPFEIITRLYFPAA